MACRVPPRPPPQSICFSRSGVGPELALLTRSQGRQMGLVQGPHGESHHAGAEQPYVVTGSAPAMSRAHALAGFLLETCIQSANGFRVLKLSINCVLKRILFVEGCSKKPFLPSPPPCAPFPS